LLYQEFEKANTALNERETEKLNAEVATAVEELKEL
jgi:hypothetical protein